MATTQFKSFKPRRYKKKLISWAKTVANSTHIGPDNKPHLNKEICANCGWTMGEHYGTDPYSECPTPKKK